MLSTRNAHFVCAVCAHVITIDRRVPIEVIRDEFTVFALQRTVAGGRVIEHPLVCSDGCHAAANRTGLPGWEIAPWPPCDEDAEVVMPPISGAW
jgi:hypothetical protein